MKDCFTGSVGYGKYLEQCETVWLYVFLRVFDRDNYK